MAWYKIGTITVTNGTASVTGAGTSWVDVGTLNAGDILVAPDGKQYEILSIGSNTGLTLASNYLGTSLGGQAYAIYPIGLLPSTLAQQVKSTLSTANTALASAVRYDTAAMGLTASQQQNARANIGALGASDVGVGRLSKSVAGGVDVTLTATEAANQFIELTGTLTASINVIVPAATRLFFIFNNTSGAFTVTVKTPSGTGVTVTQGYRMMLECDATNVVNPFTGRIGNDFVVGSLGVTGDIYTGTTGGQVKLYGAGTYGSANTEYIAMYHNGSSGGIFNSLASGTGTTRPFQWLMDSSIKMTLSTSGYFTVTQNIDVGSAFSTASGFSAQFQHQHTTLPYAVRAYHTTDVNSTTSNFITCDAAASILRAGIRTNGGLANYSANNVNISDERLKKNFSKVGSYLSKFRELEFFTFLYKDQTDDELNLGVKAQQVLAVAPELVDQSGFGKTPIDGIPFLSIYQTDFQYATAVALQENIFRVDDHESRISSLEGRIH